VASAPDTGKYRSRDLPPGEVRLTAMRDGYAPQTLPAVVADGATTPLDFSLKKLILTGTLTLVVTDTKTKKGLPAQIEIEGPEKKSLVAGADGKLEVELKPGDYRVTITHPKHNARQKDLTIENGAKVLADIELSPKIRRKLVILRKHKLQLKRKVHFQTGKAEILPDSYQLLDQVIDTIVSNHIEKIRVEGHTDSRGSDAANLRLSQARAEAVRTYLVERGISPDRIEAKGYGETRPIAPNLTKRGRAMNRRVEFHIVER
jgi:outer membrane protein OmpA-like peptidoglycan-associated protein